MKVQKTLSVVAGFTLFALGVIAGCGVANRITERIAKHKISETTKAVATGHPPPLSLDVFISTDRPDLLLAVFDLITSEDSPLVMPPDREGGRTRVMAGVAAEQEMGKLIRRRRQQ